MTCTHKRHRTAKQCQACHDADKAKKKLRPEIASSFTNHGETAEATILVDREIVNDKDMIRVCKIDTDTWYVKKWVCNVWHAPSDDGVTRLHQVKAWLERKTAVLAVKDEVAALKAEAKATMPRVRLGKPVRVTRPDHMLEVNLFDLHLGKLAWSQETGHGDYDLKIAVALADKAIDTLLARVQGFKFAEIIVPIGNDLLNADNKQNTTTRGTPQDTDSRAQKSFVAGRKLMARVLEKCAEIAPTRGIVVPGNHDEFSTWCLGDSLECYFARTPRVTIDNAPTLRKYHRWEQTLLMFTHGDKGRKKDYPMLMATERPKDFGDTTYREVHLGHFHGRHSFMEERNGVLVRTMPSLSEADNWHAGMGYVKNLRSALALVWHKSDGEVASVTFTAK